MIAIGLPEQDDLAGPSPRERFAQAASDFEAWSIEPMLEVAPDAPHE